MQNVQHAKKNHTPRGLDHRDIVNISCKWVICSGTRIKCIWCSCRHLTCWLSEWDYSDKQSFSACGYLCVNNWRSPKELRHRIRRRTSTEQQIIVLQCSVSVNQRDWKVSNKRNKHNLPQETLLMGFS